MSLNAFGYNGLQVGPPGPEGPPGATGGVTSPWTGNLVTVGDFTSQQSDTGTDPVFQAQDVNDNVIFAINTFTPGIIANGNFVVTPATDGIALIVNDNAGNNLFQINTTTPSDSAVVVLNVNDTDGNSILSVNQSNVDGNELDFVTINAVTMANGLVNITGSDSEPGIILNVEDPDLGQLFNVNNSTNQATLLNGCALVVNNANNSSAILSVATTVGDEAVNVLGDLGVTPIADGAVFTVTDSGSNPVLSVDTGGNPIVTVTGYLGVQATAGAKAKINASPPLFEILDNESNIIMSVGNNDTVTFNNNNGDVTGPTLKINESVGYVTVGARSTLTANNHGDLAQGFFVVDSQNIIDPDNLTVNIIGTAEGLGNDVIFNIVNDNNSVLMIDANASTINVGDQSNDGAASVFFSDGSGGGADFNTVLVVQGGGTESPGNGLITVGADIVPGGWGRDEANVQLGTLGNAFASSYVNEGFFNDSLNIGSVTITSTGSGGGSFTDAQLYNAVINGGGGGSDTFTNVLIQPSSASSCFTVNDPTGVTMLNIATGGPNTIAISTNQNVITPIMNNQNTFTVTNSTSQPIVQVATSNAVSGPPNTNSSVTIGAQSVAISPLVSTSSTFNIYSDSTSAFTLLGCDGVDQQVTLCEESVTVTEDNVLIQPGSDGSCFTIKNVSGSTLLNLNSSTPSFSLGNATCINTTTASGYSGSFKDYQMINKLSGKTYNFTGGTLGLNYQDDGELIFYSGTGSGGTDTIILPLSSSVYAGFTVDVYNLRSNGSSQGFVVATQGSDTIIDTTSGSDTSVSLTNLQGACASFTFTGVSSTWACVFVYSTTYPFLSSKDESKGLTIEQLANKFNYQKRQITEMRNENKELRVLIENLTNKLLSLEDSIIEKAGVTAEDLGKSIVLDKAIQPDLSDDDDYDEALEVIRL